MLCRARDSLFAAAARGGGGKRARRRHRRSRRAQVVGGALAKAAPGDVLHLAARRPCRRRDHRHAAPHARGRARRHHRRRGQGQRHHASQAADATLRGLTIRNSGKSLIDKNSGVFVDRGADGARDRGQSFREQSDRRLSRRRRKTRWCETTASTACARCGRTSADPASHCGTRRVRASSTTTSSFGRDGVFSVHSRDNVVRGNSFHDLRFAVHFMYTNDSDVIDNFSVGNDIGYAMMYSDHLRRHRQCVRPRPRPRPALQLRQRLARRRQRRARQRQMRVHLQRQQEPLFRQLVRGLRRSASISPPAPNATDDRQRLRQQPHPGDVCRHDAASTGR